MRTKDLLAAKPVSEVYTFKRAYLIESRCICTSQESFVVFDTHSRICVETNHGVEIRLLSCLGVLSIVQKISYPPRGAAGVEQV